MGGAHDVAALAARMARALHLPDSRRALRALRRARALPAVDRGAGLAPLGDALRHVTEHFDGTGGPDGLAGEADPAPSRVVRVAVEHVQGLGDDPLAVLREHAGTRLDPAVVDALGHVLHAHAA